jgi:hypothetical protein
MPAEIHSSGNSERVSFSMAPNVVASSTFIGVMQPVIEQVKNTRDYMCNLPGIFGMAATTLIGTREQVTAVVEEKLLRFPLGIGEYLHRNELVRHAAGRIHDMVFDTRVVFAVATPLNIMAALLTTALLPSVAGGVVGLGVGQIVAGLTRSTYLSARSLFYYRKTDKLTFPTPRMKAKYPTLEKADIPAGLPFALLSALPLGTLMIPAVGFVGTLGPEDLNGMYRTAKGNIANTPLLQSIKKNNQRSRPDYRL